MPISMILYFIFCHSSLLKNSWKAGILMLPSFFDLLGQEPNNKLIVAIVEYQLDLLCFLVL